MEQPQLTSRVVDLFLDLCAIPSPPGEERAVADRVTRELGAIGLEWDEDDSGPAIGSTAGNVLCRLPGRSEEGTPIFLCAHFDTVPLAGDLEPVVDEHGVVRNAGGTILGADNKSALAVMVEAARRGAGERRGRVLERRALGLILGLVPDAVEVDLEHVAERVLEAEGAAVA